MMKKVLNTRIFRGSYNKELVVCAYLQNRKERRAGHWFGIRDEYFKQLFPDEDISDLKYRGWYFHGPLAFYLRYDMGIIVNASTFGPEFFKIDIPMSYFGEEEVGQWRYLSYEGIVDVKVVGVDSPCTGYFWHPHIHTQPEELSRGLIVFKNDIEGNEYAKECFIQKRTAI